MDDIRVVADVVERDMSLHDLLYDIFVSGARRMLSKAEMYTLEELMSLDLVVRDRDTGALNLSDFGQKVAEYVFEDWDREDYDERYDPYEQGYDDDY